MKTIKTVLILICISLFGCDNNDDQTTPDPVDPTITQDGFTHNSVFYETANAYFEIDEDDDSPADGFPDNYAFFFSNGRMFDNDANVNGTSGDFLFSLDTTSWVFLNIEVSDNPSLASSLPVAGITYIVSSVNDSVIVENGQINSLSTPYFNNSIEFGMGDETVGIINTPGSQGPTITINTINLNNSNPSASTIDADYTFMNQNGDIITGHYEGTFGVILD